METFLKVIEGSALTATMKQTRLYEDIADKGGLISKVIYKLKRFKNVSQPFIFGWQVKKQWFSTFFENGTT